MVSTSQREIAMLGFGCLDAVAPIVTGLEPDTVFDPVEASHQDDYEQRTNQPYCRVVIAPKVAKLRGEHLARPAR